MKNGKSARLHRGTMLGLFLLGVLLAFLSLGAEFLGLDRTPGFGLLQMFELLVGVTFMTVAAYMRLQDFRRGAPRSLQADIGVRLSLTGLVFCYVAGLSDLLRIGTHIEPRFERPFVGPLQLGGLILGVVAILVGMVLYYTSRGPRKSSSMEFIVNGNGDRSAVSRKP